MRGIWVRSLVREESTATKPRHLETVLCNGRSGSSEKPVHRTRSRPCSLQLEKAHTQQRRPSATKNKSDNKEKEEGDGIQNRKYWDAGRTIERGSQTCSVLPSCRALSIWLCRRRPLSETQPGGKKTSTVSYLRLLFCLAEAEVSSTIRVRIR